MEDDFFASLEPSKPSSVQKKDTSKFDAIAAELKRKKMIEKAVQEADLDNACELFGKSSMIRKSTASKDNVGLVEDSIDVSLQESKAIFSQLAAMIIEKVSSFKSNKNNNDFVDELVNGLLKKCGNASLSKKLAQMSIGASGERNVSAKPAVVSKKSANIYNFSYLLCC